MRRENEYTDGETRIPMSLEEYDYMKKALMVAISALRDNDLEHTANAVERLAPTLDA